MSEETRVTQDLFDSLYAGDVKDDDWPGPDRDDRADGPAADTTNGDAMPEGRPAGWNAGLERAYRRQARALRRHLADQANGTADQQERSERAYRELDELVNRKYHDLTGEDLPKAMARNLEQLLTLITQAPFHEPERGPGLWAKMPQDTIQEMVEARPVDLTGDPSRTEIDLMMLHTIRMGRFLTTHYPAWARTLPACWIRHDDVVQEVYALKCYMDMVVASPNGGMYAPSLQAAIAGALERVKADLTAGDANAQGHAHHLSATEDVQREDARMAEYRSWHERSGGWQAEPPFEPGWRYMSADQAVTEATDLATPTRTDAAQDDAGRDDGLRGRIDGWRAEARNLRSRYEQADGPAEREQAAAGARHVEENVRRAWLEYTAREALSRDRLDRMSTAAARMLHDGAAPGMDASARATLEQLVDQARRIIREHGRSTQDEHYEPVSASLEDDLSGRIERLIDGDPSLVFDRIDTSLDRFASTIGGVA